MNSPFKWEVVDGYIVRIKQDGKVFGRLEVTDTKGICELISQLDEDLWTVRKNLGEIETNLQSKIKLAKKALE